MADDADAGSSFDFRPTLKQRRIRTAGLALLTIVILMLSVGATHPFFRSSGSEKMRDLAREAVYAKRMGIVARPEAVQAKRAVAVRIMAIAVFWACLVVLSAGLFIVAWLDIRELRRRMVEIRSQLASGMIRKAREDVRRQ